MLVFFCKKAINKQIKRLMLASALAVSVLYPVEPLPIEVLSGWNICWLLINHIIEGSKTEIRNRSPAHTHSGLSPNPVCETRPDTWGLPTTRWGPGASLGRPALLLGSPRGWSLGHGMSPLQALSSGYGSQHKTCITLGSHRPMRCQRHWQRGAQAPWGSGPWPGALKSWFCQTAREGC